MAHQQDESSLESGRPEIAVVDDARASYFAWQAHLRDQARVHHFASPSEFWLAARRDPDLLGRLCAVVVDHRFPNTREDGIALARALRERLPALRLVLSSCDIFQPSELELFDEICADKMPIPLASLVGR
jgi:CheY-like chemotaxis protein